MTKDDIMLCGHCRTTIPDMLTYRPMQEDDDGGWWMAYQKCPACQKLLVFLVLAADLQLAGAMTRGTAVPMHLISETPVRPREATRPPCPEAVPPEIADDYTEACQVLPYSAKASAAMSRRCLQNLIRDFFGITDRDLAVQIDKLLVTNALPPYLAENVDAIRNIGNFAAHPQKSQHTGEVLPVEPGEAIWNLDVLEQLFEFSFVQRAKAQAQRNALNQKLKEAGKPPMK